MNADPQLEGQVSTGFSLVGILVRLERFEIACRRVETGWLLQELVRTDIWSHPRIL